MLSLAQCKTGKKKLQSYAPGGRRKSVKNYLATTVLAVVLNGKSLYFCSMIILLSS